MNEFAINSSLPATDKFSWRRMAMVGRYFYPALRQQIIIYPLISIAMGVLSFLMFYSGWVLVSFGLLSLATSFMYYWGALAFVNHSSAVIETSLPATGSEKATFIILYSLVGVWLMLWLPREIAYNLLSFIFGDSHELSFLSLDYLQSQAIIGADEFSNYDLVYLSKLNYVFSAFESMVPTVTCLYVVFHTRKSRSLKAMAWSVAAIFAMSILIAVGGFIYIAHSVTSGFSLDTNMAEVVDSTVPVIITCGIISGLYSAFMIWLTARTIKHKQV